jgi:hypothetical protein
MTARYCQLSRGTWGLDVTKEPNTRLADLFGLAPFAARARTALAAVA